MWRKIAAPTIAATLPAAVVLGVIAGQAAAEQLEINLTGKGNPESLIKFVGPNVQSATELTDDGLVIRLPVDAPGRPQVGVETRFWVSGNFEITGEYEIVKTEEPSKGYGLGLILRIIKDSRPGQRGFISRFLHPRHGSVYSTNIATSAQEGMKNSEQYYPTNAMSGQLKLKREGATLSFRVAEGDEAALSRLRPIFEAAGGRWLAFAARDKSAWHASTVAASNFLVTIQGLARELAERAGLPEAQAVTVLCDLQQGVLDTLRERTPQQALTGPIERADEAACARLVAAASGLEAHQARLFTELARATLALARDTRGSRDSDEGLECLFSATSD